MAHTPGPWECEQIDEGHEIRMGTAIACRWNYETQHIVRYDHDVDDEDNQEQFEEAEANAKLIAASPVLLAACEAITDQFPPEQGEYGGYRCPACRHQWREGPERHDSDCPYSLARAAIRKAKGA